MAGDALNATADRRDVEGGDARKLKGAVTDRDAVDAFLATVDVRTRSLSDPAAATWETVRALGEGLGASRCTFASIDWVSATVVVNNEWTIDGLLSGVGSFPISIFSDEFIGDLGAGHPVVCRDASTDPRVSERLSQVHALLSIQAVVCVPVMRDDVWVGLLVATSAAPRDWTDLEVELAARVAERGWLVADYARLVATLREREHELAVSYRRAILINRISGSSRLLDDPVKVQQTAVEILAEELGADRCVTAFADRDRDLLSFVAEWKRDYLPTRLGTVRFSSLNTAMIDFFPTGGTTVIDDVLARTWAAPMRASMEAMRTRAIMLVPLTANGEVVSSIIVYMADKPREWKPDEVGFVEAVAAQVRAAMEAYRLLDEAKARAEREVLINRVGRAVRAQVDPVAIQQAVVDIVGSAFQADRCFYAAYDSARDSAMCSVEWKRGHLRSIVGTGCYSQYRDHLSELFLGGETAVVNEVESCESARVAQIVRSYENSAMLAVPLHDGPELVAALFVGMCVPRFWTPDEVFVVEQSAALTRAAIVAARSALREQAIADRLQTALQPSINVRIDGLDVKEFYRPALDEANVGGDFYDVFALDDRRYALIVGDLSGKGLDAAAQVATVRNMLRYALYTGASLTQSIADLNATLVRHGLLAGFATVFVGCYNADTRELTYINCGQEPAIIVRADRVTTEQLSPTYPVLGTDSGLTPVEKHVTLSAGDLFVIYTDGVTEVGVHRCDVDGVDRLIDLLTSKRVGGADETIGRIVTDLDDRGDIYSCDDQCVLVGVVR